MSAMNLLNFVPTNQESCTTGIEILDTTVATSSTASLVLAGGITIFSTADAINFNSGGTLLTFGGIAVSKSTIIGGITSILNTTISTNISTGALIVNGGIGVLGNINTNYLTYNFGTMTNLLGTNATITNLSTTTLGLTNLTISNLSATNISSTNSIFTNLSTSSLNLTNVISTNSTINSSLFTNITVSNTSKLNFLTATLITTSNILVTGSITSSNTLLIDALNSATLPASIIFKNTSGTGDFRIYGDGGDIQWQGGGGRSLQMGSWHEIRLTGGRTINSNIPFINGSNATYNTLVVNSNDSIGLSIVGNTIQTADLQQWNSNTGTIYAKIDKIGNLLINSTADCTGGVTANGSIITLGGLSTAKCVNIGSNTNSTGITTGALVVSGGAGFNGDIYAKNIYNNGTLVKSSLWGTEYNYVELLSSAGTTSSNFTQRISLTSGSLLGGTYNINMAYWFERNSNTGNNSEFQIILDQTILSTGNLLHQYIDRLSISAQVIPKYDTRVVTLSSGVHTLSMIFRNINNGSSTNISNARLELFRNY